MFVKVENNVVTKYPIHDIRIEFPNTSFPEIIVQEHLPLGYYIVEYLSPESYNPTTHKIVPFETPRLIQGVWSLGYDIVEYTAAELQEINLQKALEIRKERDRLLAECDWTQGKDIPDSVSSIWVSYRQSLRDITASSGFPFDVVWPSAP